jgi:thioesterase domain-containing protein/NRPS condensation-like uncharacterized protein
MQSAKQSTESTPAISQKMTDTGDDVYVMPATPSQIRFWLLDRMHHGNHALNMPIAWTCRGNFDRGKVAAALSELVRRHESLRTTFEVVEGRLSQAIHPPFELHLSIEDLRHMAKNERQQQASVIIRSQARIPMDLEIGPLIFAHAVRMTADEHILLITIHHSVCDGWSNGVVLRDFAAIYDGLMREVPSSLPELTIQFGDFAVWLDQWRKSKESAESLKYWRETLGGNFTRLRIQRDSPGGDSEGGGDIETLLLAQDLVKHARDFCATRGLTLYMLLLAAYAATLYSLTGQEDILIGTPCANRRQETEDLIGPFSNPQVIRMRMEKWESLGAVIEKVRLWALGSVAHQTLPFEDLNEDEFFAQERNQLSLQVYFIFQKAFMQPQHTPSLDITPLRSVSPGTMFDLLLSIVERAEGPRLQLEYNPGFFRASTIQRILQLFVRSLETMLSATDSPLGSALTLDGNARLSMVSPYGGQECGISELPNGTNESMEADHDREAPIIGDRREDCMVPRDALEAQIVGIWEKAMGIRGLSIRDNFFDLGGQSLAAMRIVSRINKTYSLDFGLAALFSGNTAERMAELIRHRLGANSSSAIVPMHLNGTASPLFIIHGAGGNIIRFYQLAMLIGTDHPVYGIQAQSLLAGQPALLRLEDQAAYYLSEIKKVQPKGPYYFLGYSFGGTIALEIGHQLHAQGERVELLGMLDSRHRDVVTIAQQEDSLRTHLDRRIARFLGNFVSLPMREKINYLREKIYTRTLRKIYSMASTLGFRSVPSFMKSTDDISWVTAMNYQPRPWPGQITLFRTEIQPDPRLPLDLGWTAFAEEGIEVLELPGDHDLIFREPYIQVMAEKIRERLIRSGTDQSTAELLNTAEVELHLPATIAK